MIHQYKAKGYNFVLDVFSGSVHLVDEISYDIIGLMDKSYKKNEIKEEICSSYDIDEDEFNEAYGEIQDLIDQGLLFSEDDFKDLSLDLKKRPTFLKALCLNVAHTCNLSCEYCFAKGGRYHGKDAIMTLDVAKRAIDFLLENSGSHYNLDIDFFGGEPLLNWDLVKETVAYCKEKEETYNKKFHFTLTTNGVLLDEEKTEFLNENMKNVVLSLDGRKEVHDKFRRTLGGEGSFDRVVPNFQTFVKNRGDREYYMRGTYTANNLDFSEDIKEMLDLGFERTSLEPVVADASSPYAIRESDLPTVYDQYEKLADLMIERIDQDRPFVFYHFMIDLTNGPCVYKRISGCGSGSEYMAVTPTGDLYPCHQFVGNPDFKLGNVFTGIEKKDIIEDFKTCNVYSKRECDTCRARMYCSGGCPANAYNSTGSITGVYDLQCQIFRKRIEMALAVKAHEVIRENQKEKTPLEVE